MVKVFGDDGSQMIMLAYYLTLNILKLKENKGTNYDVDWT